MARIDRGRFLGAGLATTLAIFLLDIWFHGQFAAGMYAGYPLRDMRQIHSLFPFLFATYAIQLLLFCYMYLRLYPQRGLVYAVFWGLWGGFFVVIPNMQFFVTVKGTSWGLLTMQVVEGMAVMVLTAVIFELAYRPRPGKVRHRR